MRKIESKAILTFSTLTTLNGIIVAAFCGVLFYSWGLPSQHLYILAPLLFFISNIATYRITFYFLGFPQQQIMKNTTEDLAFQLYALYYIVFFNFFVHNSILPLHLNRLFNKLLGAKFGLGSYNTGFILDPPYTKIGHNSIVGFSAVLCCHALEGENIAFENIKIGNNVTIGLRSMIMPGVVIDDNAIVAAGALVTKNTHIKSGEVWAGVPAKCIKNSLLEDQSKIIDINMTKLA